MKNFDSNNDRDIEEINVARRAVGLKPLVRKKKRKIDYKEYWKEYYEKNKERIQMMRKDRK